MQIFEYTVTDPIGIHARPAGLLVREASKYKSEIKLIFNGKDCSAKGLFGVMGMGVKGGDMVKLTAEGIDEEVAIKNIKEFFEKNL